MTTELQNKAWSCLPKEFKEEVKKIWGYENKELVPIDAVTALNGLLGRHNLTSDAEGEVMLMVSRKRVQELYKNYCTERDNEEKGSVNRFSLSARIAMLEEFFGSKCLPDDVAASAPNVDSLEPKPAEPKFKMGDIVRFKYCYTPHRIDGFKMSDDAILYQVGEVWAEESDLEPYTEPTRKEAKENENAFAFNNPTSTKSDDFDSILKDGFRNERRLNIATQIMSAILSNQRMLNNLAEGETTAEGVVKCIVDATMMYTDALIAEAEKGGCHEKA